MRYFYARVSTRGQHIDRQLLSAKNYGKPIDRIFEEKQSGKDFNRPVYQEMKSILLSGDEIVVHALDRLGRNKAEMKAEIVWFKEHGITLRVLDVPTTLIDFPAGQEWVMDMVTNILIEVLGSISERERETMLIRQREGLEAKRERGDWDNMGRPKAEYDKDRFEKFLEKTKRGLMTVTEACSDLGISRNTWYRAVRNIA